MNLIISKSYHNKAVTFRHMMMKSLLEKKTAQSFSLDLKLMSPFEQAGKYRCEKETTMRKSLFNKRSEGIFPSQHLP